MSVSILAESFAATGAGRLTIIAGGATAVAALVGTFGVLVGRRQARVERRIAGYELATTTGVPLGRTGKASAPQTAVVQQGVELAERLAGRSGLLARTERMLEQADLPIRAAELLFYAPVLGILAFFLVSLIANVLVGLVLGGLVVLLPFVTVERRRASRVRRFEEMLPPTLTLMASSMRAGFSLMQALETVATETVEPVRRELQRVFTEVRLGRPVEDALSEVAERMDSNDLAWTVMAIRIQREVGGNLAALLDTVADTMTKRAQLRREVRSLTAEGRLSAIVLSCAPFAVAFMMWSLRPDYVEKLFEHAAGIIAVIAAVILNVVGWFALRKIIDIEA